MAKLLWMLLSENVYYITKSFVTQRRCSIHQIFDSSTDDRLYCTLGMFVDITTEKPLNYATSNSFIFSGFFHDHFVVEDSLKYETGATSFNCDTVAKIRLY